jgi:hypothetical protein
MKRCRQQNAGSANFCNLNKVKVVVVVRVSSSSHLLIFNEREKDNASQALVSK